LLPSVGNAQVQCEPNANEITVFQHSNYRGKCSTMPIGSYVDSGAMRMKNDSTSSIKIGRNVEAIACKNSWRGSTRIFQRKFFRPVTARPKHGTTISIRGNTCQLFTRSLPSMKGTRIGNDQISAISVRLKTSKPPSPQPTNTACKPGDNQVAFYRNTNFTGGCVVKNLGNYQTTGQMGIRNDSISSIEVGKNVYVNACQHTYYRGRCSEFRKSNNSIGRIK